MKTQRTRTSSATLLAIHTIALTVFRPPLVQATERLSDGARPTIARRLAVIATPDPQVRQLVSAHVLNPCAARRSSVDKSTADGLDPQVAIADQWEVGDALTRTSSWGRE